VETYLISAELISLNPKMATVFLENPNMLTDNDYISKRKSHLPTTLPCLHCETFASPFGHAGHGRSVAKSQFHYEMINIASTDPT
jgi:hypothetical protein